MDPTPVPVSVVSTRKTLAIQANGSVGGYLQHNLIGSGHQGPEMMTRIIMSLKSGIQEEIKWALTSLSQISCTSPSLVNFEKTPYLAHELIGYFIKPFQMMLEKKDLIITQGEMLLSLDSLLSLRNLAQDLVNQQYLSQLKTLKKHLIEVLKIFVHWFYVGDVRSHHLTRFHNQFREGLNYLIDLLEPLSCYYVDNTKNDPLFNQLLFASLHTKDKYLLINIMRILSHLLFIKDTTTKPTEGDNNNNNDEKQQEELEEELSKTPNNCIDAIEEVHLENIVFFLLIADNELSVATLEFLKQYLSSEALHPSYPTSVKDSQAYRLKKLLQIKSSRAIYQTLIKELPILMVSNLSLNDPSKIPDMPPLSLTKRSQYISVPTVLPLLSKQLYDIIVKFPEPLRATTWLRCCYEPFSKANEANVISDSSDVIPGEVTQISLWKAYEKQFEEVWQTSKTQANPEWPPLLPAVDFIKNVNSAFPNSEAMVVNLNPESMEQQPKKKFIIKGIQPRQFVVNIDIGNYEALRQKPTPNSDSTLNADSKILPIGHIDIDKFQHNLNNISDALLAHSSRLRKDLKEVTPINLISHDLLDYIISEVLDNTESDELQDLFRLYNSHWLPDLIYSNPSLIENGLVNSKWLKYLL